MKRLWHIILERTDKVVAEEGLTIVFSLSIIEMEIVVAKLDKLEF